MSGFDLVHGVYQGAMDAYTEALRVDPGCEEAEEAVKSMKASAQRKWDTRNEID